MIKNNVIRERIEKLEGYSIILNELTFYAELDARLECDQKSQVSSWLNSFTKLSKEGRDVFLSMSNLELHEIIVELQEKFKKYQRR